MPPGGPRPCLACHVYHTTPENACQPLTWLDGTLLVDTPTIHILANIASEATP